MQRTEDGSSSCSDDRKTSWEGWHGSGWGQRQDEGVLTSAAGFKIKNTIFFEQRESPASPRAPACRAQSGDSIMVQGRYVDIYRLTFMDYTTPKFALAMC